MVKKDYIKTLDFPFFRFQITILDRAKSKPKPKIQVKYLFSKVISNDNFKMVRSTPDFNKVWRNPGFEILCLWFTLNRYFLVCVRWNNGLSKVPNVSKLHRQRVPLIGAGTTFKRCLLVEARKKFEHVVPPGVISVFYFITTISMFRSFWMSNRSVIF